MHSISRSAEDRASISVVIPVYNGGKAFQHCLDSLSLANPAPDEIIVVDDGSTDESALVARRLGLQVFSTSGRKGPAEARNIGAKHARGQILFFVDADCSIKSDAIEQIHSIMGEDPQVDAIVGSYDDAPTANGILSQYKNLLHHYMHQSSGPCGYTFWGACGAIRREVFEQVGGFDRTYSKASIEDIELGYRLVAAGKRICMNPRMQVTHHKRWRPYNLFHTDLFLRAIPWSRLILKSGRMDNSLNISKVARVRVLLSGLIAACAVASIFIPALIWLVGVLLIALLIADLPILGWFYRKRGFLFTLAVVPWHWFSHFYSGVGFATALVLHAISPTEKTPPSVSVVPPVAEPVVQDSVSI